MEEVTRFVSGMKDDVFKKLMEEKMKKVNGLKAELKKEEDEMMVMYVMEKEAAEWKKEREEKKEVVELSDEERGRRWREREEYEAWYRDHRNDPSYKSVYEED